MLTSVTRNPDYEINKIKVLKITYSITEAVKLNNVQDYSCLVYGYGSQPKKLYKYLANQPGLEVFDYYVFSPWFLKPIALFAAAYGGLIKILNPDKLQPIRQIRNVKKHIQLMRSLKTIFVTLMKRHIPTLSMERKLI